MYNILGQPISQLVMQSRISIIVAVDKNRAIGKKGELLWRIPEDLRRFREITSGHPVIMGRITHQSIGKVLSGRTNIIITKDSEFKTEGVIVAHSLEEALKQSQAQPGDNEIFIIGGGQIYKQFLPLADKLYLTLVEGNYEADTFFPDYSDFKKVIYKSPLYKNNGYCYSYLELEK